MASGMYEWQASWPGWLSYGLLLVSIKGWNGVGARMTTEQAHFLSWLYGVLSVNY